MMQVTLDYPLALNGIILNPHMWEIADLVIW